MSWTDEELISHLKELFKAMKELKTNLAEDAQGNVWALGAWYGEPPHFRRNFGHWSECVLQLDEQYYRDNLFPLKPFKSEAEMTEEDRKWLEFYLRSPK